MSAQKFLHRPKWDRNNPMVPVDMKGNMQHYPYSSPDPLAVPNSWNGGRVYYFKALPDFVATLKITKLNSGMSAKYFTFEDVDSGETYFMFASDMLDLLKHATVQNGLVTAKWSAVKKGQNYGIRAVQDG